MEINSTAQFLDKEILKEMKDIDKQLHLLFCNNDIDKKVERFLVDMMNDIFISGTKHKRNKTVDSLND